MARTVNPIVLSNTFETFTTFISKANTVIDLIGSVVVTTSANSVGDITSGNGFVNGIFGANTLTCTRIRAGNVATSEATVNVGANVQMEASRQIIANDVYIGNSMYYCYSTNNSTTAADQVVSSVPASVWRGGKFVVTIKNNNANGYQMTEFLVLNDGTNALYTEYATLTSNTSLGTFSANVSGGNINILCSPTSANNQITINGTLIRV